MEIATLLKKKNTKHNRVATEDNAGDLCLLASKAIHKNILKYK